LLRRCAPRNDRFVYINQNQKEPHISDIILKKRWLAHYLFTQNLKLETV
jgi:hypothetical protein